MQAHEFDLNPGLVRRLLRAQFPDRADLPLMPVMSAGTDNATYRLGANMMVCVPRVPSALEQVLKGTSGSPNLRRTFHSPIRGSVAHWPTRRGPAQWPSTNDSTGGARPMRALPIPTGRRRPG